MALVLRQGKTSGFITEICLILVLVSTIRGQNQQGNCPGMQLPDPGNGTCTLDDDCNRVTCTAPPGESPFKVLTVQAYGCLPNVKVRVTAEFFEPSAQKWSHTFEDGDETSFPMAGPSSGMTVLLNAELKKTGDNLVHYKLVMDFGSYNSTFVEGDLRTAKCESHPASTMPPSQNHHGEHEDNCPEIKLPDSSNGTCTLSDQCSKVTCKSPPEETGPFAHMEINVQAYGCTPNLKADVNLESYAQSGEAQSGASWSHTFKDGEKAELPTALTPPEGPPSLKVFLKVELKKNGGNIHFKLVMLFESAEFAPNNTTFLEGDLHASKCADNGGNDKQCPAVNFMPTVQVPSKCVYGDHCSRVTCTIEAEGQKLTVGFEANKCSKQWLKAKVTIQQSQEDLDWSHTLGDGEKAKLPVTPRSFTGGLKTTDASMFIKVNLRETQGKNVNFTVMLVGHVTVLEQTSPVNFILLQGELPVSTDDCGSWFSRQSGGVKAAVIVIPIVVMVISLAVVIGFFCYRKRQNGTRLYVDMFPGRNKFGMQRLSNEL